MEKFRFEIPCAKRESDAAEYIKEFYDFNSPINGSGGLDRFTGDYAGWLNHLHEALNRTAADERVPSRAFFLVRCSDDKIVGMINIRLALNEFLKKFGGNIGYSIRPTERGKGYSKINLYMGLKVCQKHGIKKVLLDADKDNSASWKTMEALGGVNIREFFDSEYSHCIVKDYEIDVNESLRKYAEVYEPLIERIEL